MIGSILVIFLGFGFLGYIVYTAPKFDKQKLNYKEASTIYDNKGNEIIKIGEELRDKISFNEIPQVFIDAVVATEDSRFFEHNGLDLPRFLKASLGQATGNSGAGGASTITMQVVKNNFTSTDKKITRKFTDIYLSVFKMEKNFTKEQILEFYVNGIHLGVNNTLGIAETSRNLFGKEVKDINLSEAALLAGMFQSPYYYNPYKFPERAAERRDTVLYLMKRHGYITEEEEKIAKAIPIEALLKQKREDGVNPYQSYIDICKLNGWENSEWSVLMGHNHDDCIENILTNITNKTKYENLMGMSFESEIIFRDQKIKFIRPLITIQKSDIYHCAHKFNIPYLMDSTPKWSQRGIIRDVVRPALIQWNNLILEGMVELNTIMKESLECVDLLVTKWLNELKPLESLSSNEIIRIPSLTISKIATSNIKLNIIKLNITEISDNKIFWSRLFDKLNISTSSKILDELINRLRIIKKKFTSIQIKQLNQIQINKNNKLYCWKVLDNNIIFGFDCGL